MLVSVQLGHPFMDEGCCFATDRANFRNLRTNIEVKQLLPHLNNAAAGAFLEKGHQAESETSMSDVVHSHLQLQALASPVEHGTIDENTISKKWIPDFISIVIVAQPRSMNSPQERSETHSGVQYEHIDSREEVSALQAEGIDRVEIRQVELVYMNTEIEYNYIII